MLSEKTETFDDFAKKERMEERFSLRFRALTRSARICYYCFINKRGEGGANGKDWNAVPPPPRVFRCGPSQPPHYAP